ncbi:MAG: hypothetical protein K8W52_37070 [Deltaproteobacteria bacterium]|nr:hypothetical protein [Deltaproteobacteria bacterium]
MKHLTILIATILLCACGGAKAKPSAATATIPPGEPNGCEGACERVAQCWQAQYGQADADGDRSTCEARCMNKTEEEQATYAKAMAAETRCPAILDM